VSGRASNVRRVGLDLGGFLFFPFRDFAFAAMSIPYNGDCPAAF
jgi:hypothetical protein